MCNQTQLSTQSPAEKRPQTPAAEYVRRGEVPQSPTKPIRSYSQSQSGRPDADDKNYEAVDAADESFELHGELFEAMEDVRACSDGEHDLGLLTCRLGQGHHQQHQKYYHVSRHVVRRPPSNAPRLFRNGVSGPTTNFPPYMSLWFHF